MAGTARAVDTLALRQCRVFETWDVDDAERQISQVMQPHSLRRGGTGTRFRSHMDFLKLRDIGIGTIAFGQSHIEVPPLDGYHLIIVCVTGTARIRTSDDEVDIDRQHGVVCPPHRPLAGDFSPDCEQLVIRIGKRRLEEFHGRGAVHFTPRIDLASARLQPWVSCLTHLITDSTVIALVQRDAQVAADYEQLLLRLLLAGHGDAVVPARGATAASVRRTIDFIAAHYSSALTLADLATAAGVAERTLHEAFCRFEGVSPMRYLRNVRLDHVHRQLSAPGRTESVTALATSAGFNHLGRFSQAYRDRFGKAPSEVSRRA